VTFFDEGRRLRDDLGDARRVVRLAFDDELVALCPDSYVEQRFKVAEVFVVRPEEGLDGRLRDGNLAKRRGWNLVLSLSPARSSVSAGQLSSLGYEPSGFAQNCTQYTDHVSVRIRSSRNWRGSTFDGASAIKSTAAVVFGNAITSRIEDSPASSAQIRSSPSANPP
jgi:hypothetical protein